MLIKLRQEKKTYSFDYSSHFLQNLKFKVDFQHLHPHVTSSKSIGNSGLMKRGVDIHPSC